MSGDGDTAGNLDATRAARRSFRRAAIRASVSAASIWALGNAPLTVGAARAAQAPGETARTREVFPQSVASGDPSPNGVVLWTRVDPAALGVDTDAALGFAIARDEAFADVVLEGTTRTDASRDWTVKVLVDRPELEPFRAYFYRFVADGVPTRTGRFRTLPRPDDDLSRLRLAYTSCQDYTNGWFNALACLAEEDIHYVLHLGDYIYETTAAEFQGFTRTIQLTSGHTAAETLADYRELYRTYKADGDLQRCHERHTFICIWDDHEFTNDSWQVSPSDREEPAPQPERREAASRAWAEYVPAAMHGDGVAGGDGGAYYDPSRPPLEEIRIWRDFRFGTLVHAFFTDERLHRDPHPCGETTSDKYFTTGCDELAADRTMLGAEQREWFIDGLTTSAATWKLWGNETMVMQLKLTSGCVQRLPSVIRELLPDALGGVYLSLDQWDGYQSERWEIARRLLDAGITNFVTFTGDLHSSVAGYQRADYDEPAPFDLRAATDAGELPSGAVRGDLVGTCFMSTSVTSANLVEFVVAQLAATLGIPRRFVPRPDPEDVTGLLLGSNPHLVLFDSNDHGYNVAEFTPDRLTVTMKATTTIEADTPDECTTAHEFVVPSQRDPQEPPLIVRVS